MRRKIQPTSAVTKPTPSEMRVCDGEMHTVSHSFAGLQKENAKCEKQFVNLSPPLLFFFSYAAHDVVMHLLAAASAAWETGKDDPITSQT